MGEALGRYMAGVIVTAIIVAFVIGAALALGGWFGLSWLFSHVTVGWR